ncbi:very-long-chain (3R)-3-hydroxyacyl-CoA dehydratase Phs1p [Monosporozyma unispora]|nr:Very-long-chain (3R)-3-hydroxyacyl-CoA dehydratase [Kazachstania unispora]
MAKKFASVWSPLALYNALSACGWGYILLNVIFKYLSLGQPAFFKETKNTVTLIQCGAIIEILNSLLGIVRSPIVTTAAQVLSRLLVVIGIFQLLPESENAQGIPYITLLFAWSITEIVRYLFYFYTLTSTTGAPKVLLYLRYNLFWVLYPTGVASELLIIYSSLSWAKIKYGPWFQWTLIGTMLTYIPGLPMLFLHMVAQRKKVMKSLREESKKQE